MTSGSHPRTTFDDPRDTIAEHTVDAGEKTTVGERRLASPWTTPAGPRYRTADPLGEGGMGKVVAAHDTRLNRVVALKQSNQKSDAGSPGAIRFEREALITAQLEHPGVPPLYDSGISEGQPFYTMRIVGQRTLRDALTEHITLQQLCRVLIQVCNALEYAHQRNIIHRDVKPSNVVLGDFGEVYLVDWGLARIIGAGEREEQPSGSLEPGSGSTFDSGSGSISGLNATRAGDVVGTVGYMSPEQAADRQVDPRSDLFAIGVILYEGLTGQKPHTGSTPYARLLAAEKGEFRRPNEVRAGNPVALNDLCSRLLAVDPGERPAAAAEIARVLQDFLDGVEERRRRQERARALVQEADQLAERYRQLVDEAEHSAAVAQEALEEVDPWAGPERKEKAWEMERAVEEARVEGAVALAKAVERYNQALGYDPDQGLARDGLAALYFELAESAEMNGDHVAQARYEQLVRSYDLGRWTQLLEAPATLSVTVSVLGREGRGIGREVTVERLVERQRRMQLEGEPVAISSGASVELEPAPYLVTVEAADCLPSRVPLSLVRADELHLEIDLLTASLPDALAGKVEVVPGGICLIGGDEQAFASLPQQKVEVPAFAMARYPVTFAEYCQFLDAQPDSELDGLLPEDRSARYVKRSESGHWEVDLDLEGNARAVVPDSGRLPVFAVDWHAACRYLRWLSERTGVTLRLPREVEWEKAGRGTAGWLFPWGNRFDPSFCRMRHSRPWFAQPEPVGSFPTDRSAYGIHDLAGSCREWMCDDHTGVDWETSRQWVGTTADSPRRVVVRGAGWSSNERSCHLASRSSYSIEYRNTDIGFRFVIVPAAE